MHMPTHRLVAVALLGIWSLTPRAEVVAEGAHHPEFTIDRAEVFEFTREPRVARDGAGYVVDFAVRDSCDATVAVEDARGRIVRHLASGVLGKNAPAPFRKDSLEQRLVWDGKDDQGQYIDDLEGHAIRVSLGLKPQFERTLFWSPKKRWDKYSPPRIAAAPEGVYVLDRQLHLYDHAGDYRRTLYPFPADRLADVAGLKLHEFPQDGKRLPLKQTFWQDTLLTADVFDAGGVNPGAGGFGVGAMAAGNGFLHIANHRLNRIATDGSTGGRSLEGPLTSIFHDPRQEARTGPWSSALSPDGRWLYLTGYFHRWMQNGYPQGSGRHGVLRLDTTGDAEPEPFLGKLHEPGSDNDHFHTAASVACDAEGRVYVADFLNDRVQIFAADGTFLKSIYTPKPAVVRVHQRTGEIYVFSWLVGSQSLREVMTAFRKQHDRHLSIPATLTLFGQFEKPEQRGQWPLPLRRYDGETPHPNIFGGLYYMAEIDSWSEPTTIWLVPGRRDGRKYGEDVTWEKAAIKLLQIENGELVVKRDFGAEAKQAVARLDPPRHDRQRLYVNPKNGRLYVGENGFSIEGKSFAEMLEIDPQTGKIDLLPLPFDCEDMAFDLNGHAYLRTEKVVVRFDAETWREVPFDYGEEKPSVGFSPHADGKRSPALSGLTMASVKPGCFHLGGMAVSPRGHLVVTCCNPNRPEDLRGDANVQQGAGGTGYVPRMFPGRHRGWEVHVWDKHGQLLYEDALPGIDQTFGMGMDREDRLYVLAAPSRMLDGKPYWNDRSTTLLKVAPREAKLLSSHADIPLEGDRRPDRPADLVNRSHGQAWIDDAEWLYGGVGFGGFNVTHSGGGCSCKNCRFALDLFARSFAPEIEHYSVAVLDSAGNLVLRVGRYGNVDDGAPLVKEGGPPEPNSLGGDEVGLFHAAFVATHTDRRLFIADIGNARLLSVRLGYHAEKRLPLGRSARRD